MPSAGPMALLCPWNGSLMSPAGPSWCHVRCFPARWMVNNCPVPICSSSIISPPPESGPRSNPPTPNKHTRGHTTNCTVHNSVITDTLDHRYFGSKPTSVTSESNVRIPDSAMPWERDDDGKNYKYQYHPHGDKSQPLRNAPSALNTVIVPNVTLPAVCPTLRVAFAYVSTEAVPVVDESLMFINAGPPRALQQVRQGGVRLLDVIQRRRMSGMSWAIRSTRTAVY